MNFLEFLKILFQPRKPVTTQEPPIQEPVQGITNGMEKDSGPVPIPKKPSPPLFEGGSSGGGGASAKIPSEPVKPVVTAPEAPPKPPAPMVIPDEAVTFHEALKLILRFEGGYVSDALDPGGETNKGVTHSVYDEYRKSKGLPLRSVQDISDDECADIYRTRYWLLGKCDRFPPCLAIAHFDTCVNTGTGQAAKILQRIVGVKDDGVIGPGTFNAIAVTYVRDGEKKMALEQMTERINFYNNLVITKPQLQKFLKGWLNRVNTLEKYIKDRP